MAPHRKKQPVVEYRDILKCEDYIITSDAPLEPAPIIVDATTTTYTPPSKKVVVKKKPQGTNPHAEPQNFPTAKMSVYHVFMRDKKKELSGLYPDKPKKEIQQLALQAYNDSK